MHQLFGNLKNFFKIKRCKVDNLVFRLHYKLTFALLIAFSVAVTGRQFLGDPIECISRDDIPKHLLETFCWISATFSIRTAWHKRIGDEIPYPGIDEYVQGEDRVYHVYYQWVCFVLFFQAILFYIPRYIWRSFEGHKIRHLVMDFNSPIVFAENNDNTKMLNEYLEQSLGCHTFYGTVFFFCEVLNLVNVLGQIYLMDVFLGGSFTNYGIEVLRFTEWDYTLRYDPMIKVFPRMAKCTFYRYGSSGDVQKHDAMCLIPINIMNEKIYVFLWFWFLFLAICNGLEIIYRIVIYLAPSCRYRILYRKCRRVNCEHLRKVLRHCDRNDWFVLSLLCENMRAENFKVIIRELARQLNDEKNT